MMIMTWGRRYPGNRGIDVGRGGSQVCLPPNSARCRKLRGSQLTAPGSTHLHPRLSAPTSTTRCDIVEALPPGENLGTAVMEAQRDPARRRRARYVESTGVRAIDCLRHLLTVLPVGLGWHASHVSAKPCQIRVAADTSNSWATGRQRKRAWFVVPYPETSLFIDLIPVLVASLAKSESNTGHDDIMATRVLIFITFLGVAITSTSVITALRHENGG
jgi:hypothetical protein